MYLFHAFSQQTKVVATKTLNGAGDWCMYLHLPNVYTHINYQKGRYTYCIHQYLGYTFFFTKPKTNLQLFQKRPSHFAVFVFLGLNPFVWISNCEQIRFGGFIICIVHDVHPPKKCFYVSTNSLWSL